MRLAACRFLTDAAFVCVGFKSSSLVFVVVVMTVAFVAVDISEHCSCQLLLLSKIACSVLTVVFGTVVVLSVACVAVSVACASVVISAACLAVVIVISCVAVVMGEFGVVVVLSVACCACCRHSSSATALTMVSPSATSTGMDVI